MKLTFSSYTVSTFSLSLVRVMIRKEVTGEKSQIYLGNKVTRKKFRKKSQVRHYMFYLIFLIGLKIRRNPKTIDVLNSDTQPINVHFVTDFSYRSFYHLCHCSLSSVNVGGLGGCSSQCPEQILPKSCDP